MRKVIPINREMLDQLHSDYVSASQIPAILGRGYISRAELLQQKLGELPKKEATIQMEIGLYLEEFLFKKVQEIIQSAKRNNYERAYIYANNLLAIPDFDGVDDKDDKGRTFVGEIKTTAHKDKAYDSFIIQVQTQLLCSGVDYAILYVYDFNKGESWDIIEHDPIMQDTIERETIAFLEELNLARQGIVKEPTEEQAQPSMELDVSFDNDLKIMFLELADIRAQKKPLEDREAEIKAEIEQLMQKHNISSIVSDSKKIAYYINRITEKIDKNGLKKLLLKDYNNYVSTSITKYLKVDI